MNNSNELNSNKSDLIASIAKSAVGAVPFAGSLLSELVSSVIPNQRIDRLTKYVKILEQKLSQIPAQDIEELKSKEEFIDLVEESFVQASRSISDERRGYIASILANGITNDSIDLEDSKFLLKLLQELNDVEIIWLRFFQVPTIGGDEEFRKKHENVLSAIRAYVGSDKETLQKVAVQSNYKKHLERLGLIKNHIRLDNETNMPKFDKISGQPEISYSDTTQLGTMLLEQIGMKEEKL
ncbi:hypothetical protein [Flagellimonas okinawensis]|uniref:DUF4393 domain-containing protein n=1 Tax=Flagellimonas okinawensis TaxID=3031324 RepID=A0ABT5XM70_9FLAO|nr:hypothetical protein [[Muricauda] okinawensis]MDF0706982.1 hypothetical protein [[Muricauda] okinawensis]